MEVSVFAGTFDPFTNGHEYIIKKCLKKFGKVIIIVGKNDAKEPMFSSIERTNMIKYLYKDNKNVKVFDYIEVKNNFSELLKKEKVVVYARGIRNNTDLEYETSCIEKNKQLYPFIRTEFIYTSEKFANISSTMIREKLLKNQDVSVYLPARINEYLNSIKH